MSNPRVPAPVRLGFAAAELDDATVIALEALGVDSLWSAGHVWMDGPVPEPLTSMSRLVGLTSGAVVGTAVAVAPLYPPALLAKMTAEIDRLSGGRTVVGLGVGGEFGLEFDALGVPLAERGPRTDETIGLLRRWWRGEAVSVQSRFFPPVAGLRIEPGPGRPGGPPIVIGGRREAAMRRAGALADGWLPMLYSPGAYARSVATITEHADRVGRELSGFHWLCMLSVAITDDVAATRRAAAALMTSRAHPISEDALDRVATIGDVDAVGEAMAAYVDAGVDHFVISPLLPGRVDELAQRLIEEIVPSLGEPLRPHRSAEG